MQFEITINDIRKHNPCYDPSKYVKENWHGNLLDVLEDKRISSSDKLWVVSHFAGDKLNRLFAVYCARMALKLIENPDPRSTNACDVAEKFALGKATSEELDAARTASRDAAWAAARTASRDAARYAAWAAAGDAASAAASAAARAVAWDAAWAAAGDDQTEYFKMLIKDELSDL